jgi:hypothetical protein
MRSVEEHDFLRSSVVLVSEKVLMQKYEAWKPAWRATITSAISLGWILREMQFRLGNYWPEFENPPVDRFIADHKSALS